MLSPTIHSLPYRMVGRGAAYPYYRQLQGALSLSLVGGGTQKGISGGGSCGGATPPGQKGISGGR